MRSSELALEEMRNRNSSAPPQIFISIGRPLCAAQREFKLALMQSVKNRGFAPRTVGSDAEDTDVPHDRPIEQIRRTLSVCDGAIVVAYEKHLANKLTTNSVAAHPGELSHVRFSTSWNQAEAAMAYHAELPLLLICEDGVLGECILEDGTVGSIARVPISKDVFLDEALQKRMTSWANDVVDRKSQRGKSRMNGLDVENLTLRDLFGLLGSLSWRDAIILTGVVIGILSAACSAGYFLRINGFFQ